MHAIIPAIIFWKVKFSIPKILSNNNEKMNTKTKNSHSENRVKVCGPCGKKILFGKAKKKKHKKNSSISIMIYKMKNVL